MLEPCVLLFILLLPHSLIFIHLELSEGGDISKDELMEEIRVELKHVENAFNEKVAAVDDLEEGKEPPKKKGRFLSTLCVSDGEGDDEREFNVESEMDRYAREKTIGSKDDPLQWWKKNKKYLPSYVSSG